LSALHCLDFVGIKPVDNKEVFGKAFIPLLFILAVLG
jgi:hypothetical protein